MLNRPETSTLWAPVAPVPPEWLGALTVPMAPPPPPPASPVVPEPVPPLAPPPPPVVLVERTSDPPTDSWLLLVSTLSILAPAAFWTWNAVVELAEFCIVVLAALTSKALRLLMLP